MNELKRALEVLYEQNAFANTDCDVMDKCGQNSIRLFLGIPLAYSVTLCIFAIWPFYNYYYFDHVLETPIPLSFPGVDASTGKGLIVKMALQYILIILVVIGVDYYDGIFAVMIYNTLAFSGLIVNQIEQLNTLLTDKKQSRDTNNISNKFRNLIFMHIEKNK